MGPACHRRRLSLWPVSPSQEPPAPAPFGEWGPRPFLAGPRGLEPPSLPCSCPPLPPASTGLWAWGRHVSSKCPQNLPIEQQLLKSHFILTKVGVGLPHSTLPSEQPQVLGREPSYLPSATAPPGPESQLGGAGVWLGWGWIHRTPQPALPCFFSKERWGRLPLPWLTAALLSCPAQWGRWGGGCSAELGVRRQASHTSFLQEPTGG